MPDTKVSAATELGGAGQVNLAAQAAAIAATNLVASASAVPALYRVTYYHVISRAATTSSASQLTIAWTDNTGTAKTATGTNISTNGLGDFAAGQVVISAQAASAITYAATYTSVGATTMTFALNVQVEAL